MKIGILGSGDVGQALGLGFVGLGHEVKMGTRDPKKARIAKWVKTAGPKASAGTFAEAAAFGKVLVLATAWEGTENAIRLAGPENTAGKVVIDVTNPFVYEGGTFELALGFTDSAGESIQRRLPEARVVKAFNIVGYNNMVNPKYRCGPPDMFIGGNDAAAKKTVTGFLKAFGWSVTDIGGIEMARYIEPLTAVWAAYGQKAKTWDHAFKMLRR
jgi:hypothetical protein